MRPTRRRLLTTMACAPIAPQILHSATKSTAFALIGDRYHNSDYIRSALSLTIQHDLKISIDFTDETKLLNEETLTGYKMLIIHRDGMLWPDGYPDESSNAAWVATGKPQLISNPQFQPQRPNQ